MVARLAGFVVATALLGAGCGFFMEPKPDLENKKTARVGNLSVSRAVLGSTWVGRTGTVDVKLLGEKIPSRIQTVQHSTDERTVIIVVQAPTEDWKTASPTTA